MPGEEEKDKKPEENEKKEEKEDEKKDESQKSDKAEEQAPKEEKLNPEQEKLVTALMARMSKFSTNVEEADQKILDNAHSRAEERKKLLGEIDKMKQEIDPYLEKDEEVMGQKVKVEVENALLVIMDKKIKAEEEVKELKKLLKERNNKIYELEQENKRLRGESQRLEDTLNGVPPKNKRSTQENIEMAMQSQNNDGFERAEEEPVYDQPQSQDDEDDFWQEGKGNKGAYASNNDNDLWIMGNKDNLPASNINAYNTPGMQAQPPGFKSIPKRPQGYNANDDMAFYGVGAKKV